MSNQNVTIPNPLNAGDTLTVTVASVPPPPVVTSVTVSGPNTLIEGTTAQYTAKVTGTGSFDPSVKWSASDGSITQTGLFTAPSKPENVTVTATSVQDPTKAGNQPVAISNSDNTVVIQPSGGNDTATMQSAFDSTATAGKILQLALGTWNLGPINWPTNGKLLVTPGSMVKDIPGYGTNSVMFAINVAGVSCTATGAFFSMPNSFAQSQKDGSEFRHCFAIGQGGQASNVVLTGLNVSEAGGDGLYIRNCTNVVVNAFQGQQCFRNVCSITGAVNGLTINGITLKGGLRSGLDIEPNVPSDFLENIVLNDVVTQGNPGGGMSWGLYKLDKTTPPVSITVNRFTSTGDGLGSVGGYGLYFVNNDSGVPPAPGTIVANDCTISGCGFGGAYGRHASGGDHITFNNLNVINSNQKGTDPHFGVSAAVGVEQMGGQAGPPGDVTFNVGSITNNTSKMVNYFQIASDAAKTTFKATGTLAGATNPNARTQFP